MKLFREFFRQEPDSLDTVHPGFQIKVDGWRYNRYSEGFSREPIDLKVRVGFSNPNLLDECPFTAKIGKNTDQNVAGELIAFAYAPRSKKKELEEWAQKFDYAEIIENLDEEGVSKPESIVRIIKNQ